MTGFHGCTVSELFSCEWLVQSDVDDGKRADGELRLLLREERGKEEQEGGRSKEEPLMWV